MTERAILGICACSKPEADQNRARTLSSEPTSYNNTQTDVKQSTHRSRWQRQQRTPTPACVIGMRSVRGFGGRAYEFEIRKHRSRWKHTRDQFMASECQQQRSQRGSTLGVGWGSGNKHRRLASCFHRNSTNVALAIFEQHTLSASRKCDIFYSLRDPHQAIKGNPFSETTDVGLWVHRWLHFGVVWGAVGVQSGSTRGSLWRALGPKREQGKKTARGLPFGCYILTQNGANVEPKWVPKWSHHVATQLRKSG